MQFLHFASGHNRFTVGGKAARLIELAKFDVRIPCGFVLTVDEVQEIRLLKALGDGVIADVDEYLFAANGFAVRSSATDEDGEFSWAGQFHTRLSVPTEGLNAAVLDCAGAIDSEAVHAYAVTHALQAPQLALIIQEMVPAAFAGVLFTQDPTSRESQMVIEAVIGLGETLVSGSRSPSRYFLNRESGELVARNGASDPVLTSVALDELFQIGKRLETHFGRPQDIEWAIDETGALFITQCRDITTRVSDHEAIRDRTIQAIRTEFEDERVRLAALGITYPFDVASDTNIGEILGRHPCQMSFGLFTYIFGHGMGGIRAGRNLMGYDLGPELERGFFLLVGGQPRVSIVHDALTFRIVGVTLEDESRALAFYLQSIAQNPRLANYPEAGLYEQWPTVEWIVQTFGATRAEQLQECYAAFHDNFGRFEENLDATCRTVWIPAWRHRVDLLRGCIGTCSEIGLLHDLFDVLRTDACRQFVQVARVGFFAFDRLRRLLRELFGEANHTAHLNTLTAGVPIELNPNLRFGIALRKMRDDEESMDVLLEEFGHLGTLELDVSTPRYRERTDLLHQLAHDITGDPLLELDRSAAAAVALRDELLESVSCDRASELAHAIIVARRFLPLRELVKFEFLRAHDLIRELLLRLEATYKWAPGLIFHLDPLDLLAIDLNWDTLRTLASERRDQWNEGRQLYVPPVIFSHRLEEIGRPPVLDDATMLEGVGVTNFICEGEVVIVRSLEDAAGISRLRLGSILVTGTTDPAWSPALSVIGRQGGLVTEVGGTLAHGAVYAREIGIAAVLNVTGATRRLATGMRVRVNGPASRVEIL